MTGELGLPDFSVMDWQILAQMEPSGAAIFRDRFGDQRDPRVLLMELQTSLSKDVQNIVIEYAGHGKMQKPELDFKNTEEEVAILSAEYSEACVPNRMLERDFLDQENLSCSMKQFVAQHGIQKAVAFLTDLGRYDGSNEFVLLAPSRIALLQRWN
jgi:hypothetical protein